MSADSASRRHLTNDELAAYLDRRLDATAATRVEGHMAGCGVCRAELVDMRSLLASTVSSTARLRAARFTRPRQWLAAAAVVVIASAPLMRRAVRSRSDAAARVRSSLAPPSVAVIAPRERTDGTPGVVFAWRPVFDASSYRLTISDSSGAPLVARTTTDTTVTAALGTDVQRGRAYLWYVDCLTRDGRTVTSGIRSFSVPR
jgi:anti-sigma factor RsiW